MRRRSTKVEQKEAEKPKALTHQFSFLDTAKSEVLPFNSISSNLNDKKVLPTQVEKPIVIQKQNEMKSEPVEKENKRA
jgi:hypothetical protein